MAEEEAVKEKTEFEVIFDDVMHHDSTVWGGYELTVLSTPSRSVLYMGEKKVMDREVGDLLVDDVLDALKVKYRYIDIRRQIGADDWLSFFRIPDAASDLAKAMYQADQAERADRAERKLPRPLSYAEKKALEALREETHTGWDQRFVDGLLDGYDNSLRGTPPAEPFMQECSKILGGYEFLRQKQYREADAIREQQAAHTAQADGGRAAVTPRRHRRGGG